MKLGNFEGDIENKTKIFNYSIGLPESEDQRMVDAAIYLLQNSSLQKIYLFLSEAQLAQLFGKARFDLARYRHKIVLAPSEIPELEVKTYHHITRLAENRKKKIAEKDLLTFSRNKLYQAGYLCASGYTQVTLAGAVSTTAEVIKAGLATIPLRPGIKSLSSSFLMVRERNPAEVLLFADCGVIVEPTSEQLADIAVASCQTWERVLGDVPPVLGFISFSTKGSAQHQSLEVLRQGKALFIQCRPDVLCDGELQFDAAYDPGVGRAKCPDSAAAGRINIYIFPNLAVGNSAYKIAQRLAGFSAYGPLLQGFSCAYSDLSRGCSAKDIVMSVYINCLLVDREPNSRNSVLEDGKRRRFSAE